MEVCSCRDFDVLLPRCEMWLYLHGPAMTGDVGLSAGCLHDWLCCSGILLLPHLFLLMLLVLWLVLCPCQCASSLRVDRLVSMFQYFVFSGLSHFRLACVQVAVLVVVAMRPLPNTVNTINTLLPPLLLLLLTSPPPPLPTATTCTAATATKTKTTTITTTTTLTRTPTVTAANG